MDELQKYYEYLKGAGADLPNSVDSFRTTLSDSRAANTYYDYLKKNKFDAPNTFESFSNTLGIGKKKDGGTPTQQPSQSPSVPQAEVDGPTLPSVSDLLKQRRKLKQEKSATKPTTAPGFVLAPISGPAPVNYDVEISKIDEQIKSKGYDPKELDESFGDIDLNVDDKGFADIYKNYKTKPITTTRGFSDAKFKQAITGVLSNIQDEATREKGLNELKELSRVGSELPNYDLNTVVNFGINGIEKVTELTGQDGEARSIAQENFKKSYAPVLAQVALRDRDFASQKDLPYQMGLLYDKIFDKNKADQTEMLMSQDLSDSPDAIKGRDRRRYEVEERGLSLLQAAVGEEIEASVDGIKSWNEWQKNNIGKISELSERLAKSNPEVKSTIESANKEVSLINEYLNNSPLKIELKDQEEVVKRYEEEYRNGTVSEDAYKTQVDRYNEIAKSINDQSAQAKQKSEEIAKATKEKIDSLGASDEDVKEYDRLIKEYESFSKQRAESDKASKWVTYFENQQNKIIKNNPTVLNDNVIMQMQEWDGEYANPLEKFALGFGALVPKTRDAFGSIYDSMFLSPEDQLKRDFERVGRSNTDQLLLFYEKEKNKLFQSPVSTVVPDNIKDRLNQIDANENLNDAEKEEAKKSVFRDGFASGQIYKTTNPNAGKINITASSVLNSAATVVPQILTAAGISMATGGFASGVALSTFLNGYSSYYNDAVSRGIANPHQYATSHSFVDFATEMIGTSDLRMIQSAMKGAKGAGAKFFRDITDKEFKSLLAGSKNAFKNYGKASLKTVGANTVESGEEYLAEVGGNVVDEVLFNKETPTTQGAIEAYLTTAIGQLPLTALNIPLSVSRTNIASKYALYNAAADMRGTMGFLKKELDAGNISNQEYSERVKLINDYAKAIDQTPKTYKDGNPLRDDDKAKYAFNQFISNMKADKTPIPPQQQEEVNQVIAESENENNKIITNATTESSQPVQEGAAESNIGEPTGVVQGQREGRPGEGVQGEATLPKADVGDSNLGSKTEIAPGKKLFNEPVPEVAVVEAEFKKSKGINTPEPAPITKLDEEKSKTIADAYEALVDSPNDPEVQSAYQAMADETMEQFDAIDKAGVKVEIWTGKGEPYKNSGEMIADVRDNKHMYIFSTEEGFGDTPITDEQRQQNALLRDSGIKDVNGKPLLINDIFRFVHDYFGHSRLGNSFGAIGEENAWNVHARMYSPLARRAMTTETRGQNSWVNFNKNFRNPDGTMKKKGDEGYVPPAQRPFADQKMALLPEEFSQIEDAYSVKPSPIQQRLEQDIPMATKALEKSGIKFSIVDPTTDTEEARAARGNQAVFVSDDGTIIIDKSKLANDIEAGIVVWHEASHPVMNIIRNKKKDLYDAMVRGLNQSAQASIEEVIKWAKKNYSAEKLSKRYGREVSEKEALETQMDEAIVELIGRINGGVIDPAFLDTGLKQKIIDIVNEIAKFFGIDPIISDTDIVAFKRTVGQVANALKTGRDISEIVGAENVKEFANKTQQQRITAEEVLSQEGRGDNKVIEVAKSFEDAVDNVLDPQSDPNNRVSRFITNALEDLRYFLSEYRGDTGLDWYTNKVKEFNAKLEDASDIAIANGEMLEENSLRDKDNMDLFKVVLALSSIGVNPRENVKAAFAIWKTFDQKTKTFSKYQPGMVSLRTNIPDGKGGFQAPSGEIIKDTDKYLDIKQKSGKVVRVKKSDLAKEFNVTYKNDKGKEVSKDLRFVRKNKNTTVFRSGPSLVVINNEDIIDSTEISDGVQGKGWTTKGNVVAINLNRLESLLADHNTLSEANNWINSKHPIAELRKYNPSVPDVDGGKGKINPKGERIGSYIIGEKLGAFHQNVAGTPTELTMDLWWSRTWNRYMGTLIGTDKDGNPVIQETPRTDTERNIMREAAKSMSDSLGLEVHELQAALWYLEQQMYKKMGAAVESYSFVDGINELLLQYGKSREDIQPQRYGIDISESDQRKTDAAARATNILFGEGGTEGQRGTNERGQPVAEGAPDPITPSPIQASAGRRATNKDITGKVSKKLIDDGEGNYVFFHYSPNSFRKVNPRKFGSNLFTGRDEQPGVNVSMFYVNQNDKEGGLIWDYLYISKIPKGQVYPFNEDPLGLIKEAKAEFVKQYGNKVAFDPNKQLGFVTKVAADRGFPMTVAQWTVNGKKTLRAQTTEALPVEYYQRIKSGTMNQIETNPKYKGIKFDKSIQASAGNRPEFNKRLPDNLINSVRTSLRGRFKDSVTLDYLDQLQEAKRNDITVDPIVQEMLDNGVTLNNIVDMILDEELFDDRPQVENYLNNIGEGAGLIIRTAQASAGGREEALRAAGEGKVRDRALAKRFGDLDPQTQSKIQSDAFEYFQRPNAQTEKAVNEFLDGIDLLDAADYVLGKPDIPEVSRVWMAAEVAKRIGKQIETEQDQDVIDGLTDKQADIYNEFAKVATSLGQAVQAFVAFRGDKDAVQFFLPKILKQLKNAGVENVTEEQKQEILDMLKEVSAAPSGLPKDKAIIKLSHYLAGIAPMSPMDVLQALWYAKILSGVTTQATNFFANIFNTLFELPAVGLRISLMNKSPLGLMAGLRGLGSGIVKGAVVGADIVKTGVRTKELDKYFAENPLEYFTWSKWMGKKGKVLDKIPPLNFGAWKYVGRILAGTDALFSTANQEAISAMLAYAEAAGQPAGNNFKRANEILGNTKRNVARAKVQAKNEGFDINSLQGRRRVLEIVAQGRKGTGEADAIGKRITMNYDPEGWTRPFFDAVVGLQKAMPIVKMVIPFARIVANLTENGLNYTPVGALRAATGIRDPFKGKKSDRLTTEERIDLMSKFIIGTTAIVSLIGSVGEDDDDLFEITAGGSPDIQKRYELQKGGWRPYTITFKDGTKLNYKDWPIAGLLAGLGHIRDAKKYSFDDTDQNVLFGYGFFLNLYDKSLLAGLQDFFGIFEAQAGRGKYAPTDKMSERAKKYAAQQVKSVAISNLSQQTAKLYSELVTGDPMRDAKTFSEVIYKDLPMFNDGIRPIIDIFGDEVKFTTTERLTPLFTPEKDEMVEWLNKNKFFVGVPKKKNIINADGSERPMTEEEYYEYRKISGQKSKEWISNLMSSIKEDERQISEKFFEAGVSAGRKEAYLEILNKYGFK